MSNSLGESFRLTVFGESHGSAIGVTIDGCPAGLELSCEDLQSAVNRRKPQNGAGQTTRREEDRVEIISGLFNGRTTGAAVTMMVRNQDVDSTTYERMRFTPRPGHADYTAKIKYGGFNDYRGGGVFSGRVTVALVMAGAMATKLLRLVGIEVVAYTTQIGQVTAGAVELNGLREKIDQSPLRCPDTEAALAMQAEIEKATAAGDSLGGIIECQAFNLPVGLGEPYFDSLEGQLAKAFFAIPAVKGVEFGEGFAVAARKGSQNNDDFIIKDGKIRTSTNSAGGILGGLSNGMPLLARLAVKPTPSIALPQSTVDLQKQREVEIKVSGRHDSCIVPRAAVVVEAAAAVVLCDFALKAGIIKRIIK
jgi:chorismate synthase